MKIDLKKLALETMKENEDLIRIWHNKGLDAAAISAKMLHFFSSKIEEFVEDNKVVWFSEPDEKTPNTLKGVKTE